MPPIAEASLFCLNLYRKQFLVLVGAFKCECIKDPLNLDLITSTQGHSSPLSLSLSLAVTHSLALKVASDTKRAVSSRIWL